MKPRAFLFKIPLAALILIGTHVPSGPAEATPPPVDSDYGVCMAPPSLPAARAQAQLIVAQIRSELTVVEDQIRDVPFVAAVEAGTATPELITAVIAEEYSIVRSDWSSFAQLTSRFDDPESRRFFGGLVAGEGLAMDLLLDFAESVGLDEQDLAQYEPRPRSQTYPSRVAWIAANGDRATAAVSLLVNFAVFGENMGRIRDALVSVYGLAPEEVEFFGLFAGEIPGFEDNAIEVIAAGLRRGACADEMLRSARLLQAYELDFWEAASDPPGSPLSVAWPPEL